MPRSQIANHKPQITNHKSQITNHKSQITNHKSQITNQRSSVFQYATSRKFRHAGWNLFAPKWPTGCHRGFLGWPISFIDASWGVRLPFLTLQARHAQTTFSQEETPPRESGITWSSDSSQEGNFRPQYWQRFPSRI